jgi:ornithine--oxo-acid transaminase
VTADAPAGLAWGRRYLMCPPSHFGVLYEINPWMRREVQSDPDRSHAQWHALVENLKAAGATIEMMEPVEGLPDLVFTANAGIVDGRKFVLTRFRHPERQGEEPHDAGWFRAAEYDVVELDLPRGVCFEGAGDALPFRGRLLAGYSFRSDFPAHTQLARALGVEVLSVQLVDDRFYHLDLSFCPLDGRHAIVAPDAWDRYGRTVVERLVPEPLLLDIDEALTFCANSVVIGTTVVMPACPPRVGRQLEAWGYDVVVSPVDEFLKAGGGVRCLTLALDMTISGDTTITGGRP